jgi:hypothetical protein
MRVGAQDHRAEEEKEALVWKYGHGSTLKTMKSRHTAYDIRHAPKLDTRLTIAGRMRDGSHSPIPSLDSSAPR